MTARQKQIVEDLTDPAVVAGVFLPLWEKHLDVLVKVLKEGAPGRTMKLKQAAPYALMFAAFCVGAEAMLPDAEAAAEKEI